MRVRVMAFAPLSAALSALFGTGIVICAAFGPDPTQRLDGDGGCVETSPPLHPHHPTSSLPSTFHKLILPVDQYTLCFICGLGLLTCKLFLQTVAFKPVPPPQARPGGGAAARPSAPSVQAADAPDDEDDADGAADPKAPRTRRVEAEDSTAAVVGGAMAAAAAVSSRRPRGRLSAVFVKAPANSAAHWKTGYIVAFFLTIFVTSSISVGMFLVAFQPLMVHHFHLGQAMVGEGREWGGGVDSFASHGSSPRLASCPSSTARWPSFRRSSPH